LKFILEIIGPEEAPTPLQIGETITYTYSAVGGIFCYSSCPKWWSCYNRV